MGCQGSTLPLSTTPSPTPPPSTTSTSTLAPSTTSTSTLPPSTTTTPSPTPPPSTRPATEPVQDGPCEDANDQCLDWAAGGECSANPAYMHESCKLSCGLCQGSTPPPSTTPSPTPPPSTTSTSTLPPSTT